MSPNKTKTSSPDYPSLGHLLVKTSENDALCKPLPGLYLVATPIGNLGDISLRALVTLAHADLIACEDTRSSGFLLKSFGIHVPTISYHDHNAEGRRPEVIERLKKGAVIAVISDAGMPAIADPGFKLVRSCRDLGLSVTVIPGANAAVTAMAGCGLPTDQFYFAGFLSSKKTARIKELISLKTVSATVVFYEAPQRLGECLQDLADVFGSSRPAAVARELTKLFEETRRGSLNELAQFYASSEPKGEIVILVGGFDEKDRVYDIDALLKQSLLRQSVRDAVAEVADMVGVKKNEIYARALAIITDAKVADAPTEKASSAEQADE